MCAGRAASPSSGRCCDYLRAHAEVAAEYAAVKRGLALRFRDDRRAYVEAKGPLLWDIIRKADEWAQAQGWLPGPATP